MKRYEHATRDYLPPRTATILRVDGRAFHTLLRGAAKPFDEDVMHYMGSVAMSLCQDIAGAQFAYQQSDEVSVLITDYQGVNTQPPLGGNIQKLVSTAASKASVTYNFQRGLDGPLHMNNLATFDARVFTLPNPVEVANYFLWRQQDATRNSISMAAQSMFSHRELQYLNVCQLQDKMFTERGVNWSEYPDKCKRGQVCYRNDGGAWEVRGAPIFKCEPATWLAQRIPPMGHLSDDS